MSFARLCTFSLFLVAGLAGAEAAGPGPVGAPATTPGLATVQAAPGEAAPGIRERLIQQQENADELSEILGLAEARIAERNATIRELRRTVEALREGRAVPPDVERLETQIAGLEERLALARERLERRDGMIGELRTRLDERNERSAALEVELAARADTIAAQRDALDRRGRRIEALEGLVAARDDRIAGLEAALARRSNEIDQLTAQGNARALRIAELDDALAVRDEDLAIIRTDLDKALRREQNLRVRLGERNEAIERLRRRIAMLEARLGR